jgi:anti-sigma regulatory factor (Ser/Thr protein kinase)
MPAMAESAESFHWKILRVGSLRDCLDAWQGSSVYQKLDESCRNASALAIDEIGSNFLRFSGPNAQAMHLEFSFDGKELVMMFEDDGKPFDPGSILPPPRGNLALLPTGGRGLHMVRQSVDSWKYKLDNKRNSNVLKKKIPKGPLDEPDPEPEAAEEKPAGEKP